MTQELKDKGAPWQVCELAKYVDRVLDIAESNDSSAEELARALGNLAMSRNRLDLVQPGDFGKKGE